LNQIEPSEKQIKTTAPNGTMKSTKVSKRVVFRGAMVVRGAMADNLRGFSRFLIVHCQPSQMRHLAPQ